MPTEANMDEAIDLATAALQDIPAELRGPIMNLLRAVEIAGGIKSLNSELWKRGVLWAEYE